MIKPLLLSAATAAILFGQTANAANVDIVSETWQYNFPYSNLNCKVLGYDGGMITVNGEKVCTKKTNHAVSNYRKRSNNTWKKRTSATSWLYCNKNNKSCSQSLSTGKNSCTTQSTSTTTSTSITSNISAGIGVTFISGGVSVSAGQSWTKTSGKEICATSNLSQTCTIGGNKRVRLEHKLTMQPWHADLTVYGYKLRRLKTVKKYNRLQGELRTTYGSWGISSSRKKTISGGVQANLPVGRVSVCNAQNT